MKELDSYKDLLDSVKDLLNDETLNEEEKNSIRELDEIIRIDRGNKITLYMVERNQKLSELQRDINSFLKEYIEGTRNNSVVFDNRTYRKRIENLNTLKFKILDFKKSQYISNENQINDLTEKCIKSLSDEECEIPMYFNESIAIKNDKYILNEDLIHRLYEYSLKNSLCAELEEGSRIVTERIKAQEVVDKCLSALYYKERLKKNIKLIIEFNEVSKELFALLQERNDKRYRGLVDKIKIIDNKINKIESSKIRLVFSKEELQKLKEDRNRIDIVIKEYEELDNRLMDVHKRLGIVNLELKAKGLSDLVTYSDFKYYLGDNNHDELDILSNVRLFTSKEDLDNYYNLIEKKYNEKSLLLEIIIAKEKEFNSKASKEAIDLINEDLETARNIGRLSIKKEGELSPSIAIFILEGINKAKNTRLDSIDISEEEYNAYSKHCSNIIDEKMLEYSDEFFNAFYDNKIKKR